MTHPDRRRRGRAIRKRRRLLAEMKAGHDSLARLLGELGRAASVGAKGIAVMNGALRTFAEQEMERAKYVMYMGKPDDFKDVNRPTVAEIKSMTRVG